MKIHQTTRAPSHTAKWLVALLEPAALAAGLQNAPAVEIRPCGAGWAGFYSHSFNPDGRVCLSSKIVFWSKKSIVSVYVHECTHQLLDKAGASECAHDPRFFALQHYLYLRLSRSDFRIDSNDSKKVDFGLEPSLYDIQDAPIEAEEGRPELKKSEWLGASIDWSMATAERLLETEMTAEQAARSIVHAYPEFVQELLDRPKKLRLASDVVKVLQSDVKSGQRALHAQNKNWRKLNLQTMFFGGLGWFLLVLMVVKTWL